METQDWRWDKHQVWRWWGAVLDNKIHLGPRRQHSHSQTQHHIPPFLCLSSSRRPLDGSHSSSSLLNTKPSLASPTTMRARWTYGWRSSLKPCRKTWSPSLKPGAGLSRRKWLRAWPTCLAGRITPWRCTWVWRSKGCGAGGAAVGWDEKGPHCQLHHCVLAWDSHCLNYFSQPFVFKMYFGLFSI